MPYILLCRADLEAEYDNINSWAAIHSMKVHTNKTQVMNGAILTPILDSECGILQPKLGLTLNGTTTSNIYIK